eukprot:TRINITY_DN8365_c0_g1_i1.p3 TRINITY_DN8365_c0_g1~~TRINITY_DN8365_c0_g1_i1.p3  ORF type:complete len:101 (+),score=9.70 TRINITY_DN8365_c0_g1_i1:586-888(+)
MACARRSLPSGGWLHYTDAVVSSARRSQTLGHWRRWQLWAGRHLHQALLAHGLSMGMGVFLVAAHADCCCNSLAIIHCDHIIMFCVAFSTASFTQFKIFD